MLLGESGDRTPAPLYPLEILEFNWLEGGETQTKKTVVSGAYEVVSRNFCLFLRIFSSHLSCRYMQFMCQIFLPEILLNCVS